MTVAIAHALAILSWMELPEKDRPSEDIWLDSEALNDHFEDVRERYRNHDDDDSWESVPQAPLQDIGYADEARRLRDAARRR